MQKVDSGNYATPSLFRWPFSPCFIPRLADRPWSQPHVSLEEGHGQTVFGPVCRVTGPRAANQTAHVPRPLVTVLDSYCQEHNGKHELWLSCYYDSWKANKLHPLIMWWTLALAIVWLRLNPIEADATTLESAPSGTYHAMCVFFFRLFLKTIKDMAWVYCIFRSFWYPHWWFWMIFWHIWTYLDLLDCFICGGFLRVFASSKAQSHLDPKVLHLPQDPSYGGRYFCRAWPEGVQRLIAVKVRFELSWILKLY